ncbi:Rieske 2Fe-2S domain-containing protein, partial [Catellatospora sp. NPDC049133]
HLKADLTRFGIVEGDQLTCQLHGWKWNLATGRCQNATASHNVRAQRDSQRAANR